MRSTISTRQVRSRSERCLYLAQGNEDAIERLENRVEELETFQSIAEHKLFKQEQAIFQLNSTVRYLLTVLHTITSPSFQIKEHEGGTVIFTKTGCNQDSAVFFPHAEDRQMTFGRSGVTYEQVTEIRAPKHTSKPSDRSGTPPTKRVLHMDYVDTESVTSEAQEGKTEVTEGNGDAGNPNRVYYEPADVNEFKLTFDETYTQPRPTGSQ